MTKTITIFLAFVLLSWSAERAQPPLRPKIQSIISRLKKENVLHLGAPVGYAATPETRNKYYKLYRKLASKATDEELVLLTNDNSKILVLYSLHILRSRGYAGLKDIFLSHIDDTTDVWKASGCSGSVNKVNSYMLGYLNPKYYPKDKRCLTNSEYYTYLNQIDKAFKQQ